MASYIIGDVQGCFKTLQSLVDKIRFDPKSDRIYLLGDLVNRGPRSLETLRWAYENRKVVKTVLGNHDFLLLHCAWNGAKQRPDDTLDAVLKADDSETLVTWLSQQPLLLETQAFILVHAGLHPHWTWTMARNLNKAIQDYLTSSDRRDFVASAFEAKTSQWNPEDSIRNQSRSAVNVFTRIRICDEDGNLDFKFKGEPEKIPKGSYPWYSVPERETIPKHLYFGHWSALGLYRGPLVTGLDTGCVWGRQLTAIRHDDKKLFHQERID